MRGVSTNPTTLLRTGELDANDTLLTALAGHIGVVTMQQHTAHDGKCCARGSFDSYVQDALAAKEEALLASWCAKEGMDYPSLTDAEKSDLLEFAEADRVQEIADNGFGGLGA